MCAGVDQFHGAGHRAAAEEALAFAQDHREGHDAKFVDQLGFEEGLQKAAAAVHLQIFAFRRFQFLDGRHNVALDEL